jgi:hypothetical protein
MAGIVTKTYFPLGSGWWEGTNNHCKLHVKDDRLETCELDRNLLLLVFHLLGNYKKALKTKKNNYQMKNDNAV